MHYMHYMHYKDYIHHDFYVYSPVLLTQYLGHCWHTPCTELYILRISAWLLRKPPLPCHRGGGNHLAGGGGGVWGSLLIYIYIYIYMYVCMYIYIYMTMYIYDHISFIYIYNINHISYITSSYIMLLPPNKKTPAFRTCGFSLQPILGWCTHERP